MFPGVLGHLDDYGTGSVIRKGPPAKLGVDYQLAALDGEADEKRFGSIMVTECIVLDSQLLDTSYQFRHATGIVRPIALT